MKSCLLPFAFSALVACLAACAVDEPAPAPERDATSTAERALECEPYDPSYCDEATSCEVPSQYVQCASGIYMYAHRTPDCRWCIPRDVCGWNPPVCPF